MKIVYIANSTIPSKSANSVHVMKMCEALKENGVNVTMIVPNIGEKNLLTNKQDEFSFYGIREPFSIKYLKLISKEPIGIYQYLFSFLAVLNSFFYASSIIMTRNPIVALIAILLHKKVILEMHGNIEAISNLVHKIFQKFGLFHNLYMLKLIVISEKLKHIYMENFDITENKIEVLHDGVNLTVFYPYNDSKLFKNSNLQICYLGSLQKGRGLEMIIELAIYDQKNIYNIYGGEVEDVNYWRSICIEKNIQNINIIGHITNSHVPLILCENDILLMPYQKKVQVRGNENTSSWMSPMKMFEYMASGRVIISSDLPVIREVLNDENSYLVDPENISEWIQTIESISLNKEEARKKAKKALQDVAYFTWKNRANRIMEIINE